MPTLLEIAGAGYPKTRDGRDLPALSGKSWGPVLLGQAESPRTEQDYLAWELFGNRAVRQGEWKIRWQYKPLGKEEWELFNLAADPAERDRYEAWLGEESKVRVQVMHPGQGGVKVVAITPPSIVVVRP